MRVFATKKSINLPFIQGTAKRYKIVMPHKAFIGILAEVEPDGTLFEAQGIQLYYIFDKYYTVSGKGVNNLGAMSVARSMDYVYINSDQEFSNCILIDGSRIYTITESYPWNNEEARWLFNANQRKQFKNRLDVTEEDHAIRVKILDKSLTTDDVEYIVRKYYDKTKTIIFEYDKKS